MFYRIEDQFPNNQYYFSTMHYPGFPPATEEQPLQQMQISPSKLSYSSFLMEQKELNPSKVNYTSLQEPTAVDPSNITNVPFLDENTSQMHFPPLMEKHPFLHKPLSPPVQYSSCFPPVTEDPSYQKQYFDLPLENQPSYSELPQIEVPEPVEECIDDYSCKCDSCQNKYGSLPILLQGIEQKSFGERSDPEPSTSSQSHTSKRILTCEYCKKTFTHKGDFKKHLRKHTKEKPFSCNFCGKSFGNTSNLLRHQKLHTGEKPFACEHCNKKFSRKDKLDCHRRSRTCQEASSSRSYQ